MLCDELILDYNWYIQHGLSYPSCRTEASTPGHIVHNCYALNIVILSLQYFYVVLS